MQLELPVKFACCGFGTSTGLVANLSEVVVLAA